MEEKLEPIQEAPAQAAGTAEPAGGEPQEGAADLEARLRELERERERLAKELERTRREAAERRVEKKTLEERLAELERRWQEAERQARLAEIRARLYGHLGADEARVAAAMVLMEREGIDDPAQLLERYPFLRAIPAAPGPANPGAGVKRLRASDLATMDPQEYLSRREEILRAVARGEIALE